MIRCLPACTLLLAALTSCGKVPISPVNAAFLQADVSWFAEEQTLFVFYEVTAEQGIGDPSVIELTYTTDEERVGWTELTALTPVHRHVPVDCGPKTLCGSISVRVDLQPRGVDLRLRYHRDGELALPAGPVFNVVGPGPPHTNRSMVVYGVFDEDNEQVQWRGRHQFPTVRNMRASELGLRRTFTVRDMAYGAVPEPLQGGPFGYGTPCDESFVDAGLFELTTDTRAIFHPEPLPLEASEAPLVCAQATVTDATGTFTAAAYARKNPEVRAAFPELRSPIRSATPLRFFLAPCDRVISEEHYEMQRQRLLSPESEVPTTCTDDWQREGFVDSLIVLFRDAVDAERAAGNDMVLVVGVHRDQVGLAAAVEEALAAVVPGERARNSPHLAGAFVLDSDSRGLSRPGLAPSTLWCPSTVDFEDIPDASAISCPTLPDIPDLVLGPFQAGFLPILPTRRQYLSFIEDFSVGTAGSVTELDFLTPEFATTSDQVDLGDFGVVTFFNGESISAAPDDAFSYCVPEQPDPFVVRTEFMRDPLVRQFVREGCESGELPEAFCIVADAGLLPIASLSLWHEVTGETEYELGLFWQFPFLLRMQYQASVAGSVSAFGLSVPFGVSNPAEQLLGGQLWLEDTFSLEDTLTQCVRFCDHPTFDSAGVYQVLQRFRETYPQACYLPRFPTPADDGFPLDP